MNIQQWGKKVQRILRKKKGHESSTLDYEGAIKRAKMMHEEIHCLLVKQSLRKKSHTSNRVYSWIQLHAGSQF